MPVEPEGYDSRITQNVFANLSDMAALILRLVVTLQGGHNLAPRYCYQIYVDADGKLTKNLISENFAHWAAPPSWGVAGRIVSVTRVGDVASVQIVWDRTSIPSDVWIDFHSLIKIDGIWKITNKTATHGSRA